MIINTHAHIGISRVFDHDFTEEELINGMDKYGVDVSIVQPLIGPDHYKKYHDDIYEASIRYPKRILGMMAFSPHIDKDEYFVEIERCVDCRTEFKMEVIQAYRRGNNEECEINTGSFILHKPTGHRVA